MVDIFGVFVGDFGFGSFLFVDVVVDLVVEFFDLVEFGGMSGFVVGLFLVDFVGLSD